MSDPEQSYTCPHHKIEIKGTKRETFQTEFYDSLMWVDMMTSMRLYKDINVSCHCPENYKAFDTILKELKQPIAPESTVASPMASEEPLASSMAPKDPKLTT
jgi:hypothetical protein